MAQSKEYKTIQIPKEDFDILREYCEHHTLLMGKFVGRLIKDNCPLPKPKTNMLKAEPR